MGCPVSHAGRIVQHGASYLLGFDYPACWQSLTPFRRSVSFTTTASCKCCNILPWLYTVRCSFQDLMVISC